MKTFIKLFKQCKQNATYQPYSKEDLYIDIHHKLCFNLIINPITNN